MRYNNWNYKPESFNFHGEGSETFFGAEIEFELDGNPVAHIDGLDGRKHQENRLFHFVHDGSLTNGAELVTHPATYEYWKTTMWGKINAVFADLESGNPKIKDTCGLHIHMSKPERKIINRLHLLFAMYWRDIVKFSRRNTASISRYARGYDDKITELINRIKTGQGHSHYDVLNETNSTIEFRIFKGTLSPLVMVAYIELCALLTQIARETSFEELLVSDMELFSEIDARRHTFPTLWAYAGALDGVSFESVFSTENTVEYTICGTKIKVAE